MFYFSFWPRSHLLLYLGLVSLGHRSASIRRRAEHFLLHASSSCCVASSSIIFYFFPQKNERKGNDTTIGCCGVLNEPIHDRQTGVEQSHDTGEHI